MKKYSSIDDHIKGFPLNVQKILRKIRETIRKAAPKAEETISYGIPTFKLNGNLVHFAGYEHHIGFYPGSKAIKLFKKKLSKYETSKGTVRFSLEKEIPYTLIRDITKMRVKENTKNK